MSPPSTAPDAAGEKIALMAEPGFLFLAAAFCALGFAALGVLFAMVGPYPRESLLSMGAVSAAALAATLFLKRTWFLVVDERGVRMVRGTRVIEHIGWEQMSRVRFGATQIAFGAGVHFLIPAEFLDVRGRRRGQRVWLGTGFYRLDSDLFSQAAARVVDEARRRNVQVKEAKKSTMWP